jgi:hypothetical protein
MRQIPVREGSISCPRSDGLSDELTLDALRGSPVNLSGL